MEKLHPGAKWSFRVGAWITLFFLGIFVVPFFAQIIFIGLFMSGASSEVIPLVLFSFVGGLVFIFIFGEIYASMAYDRWRYEFGPTNLKTERGIIWKKYSNVPYERVQNVDIRRGILARMLGFSSVMIQTAGFSSGRGGVGAEGYLPAVSERKAEEIREFLMKKITKNHGAGL